MKGLIARKQIAGFRSNRHFAVQTFDEFSEMEIRPNLWASCRPVPEIPESRFINFPFKPRLVNVSKHHVIGLDVYFRNPTIFTG